MNTLIHTTVSNYALAYKQENPYTTWLEIDKNALEHNIINYKKIIEPALLAFVIKSNAYGHGIEQIAKICDQNNLVDILCTVSLSEALFLRSRGIKKRLLVLSIIDNSLDEAIKNKIDLVIYSMATALELNRLGVLHNTKVNVHLKIDTGLSRLGILADEALPFIQQISLLPFINIEGLFTHLADSENADPTFTNQQLTKFNMLIDLLEKQGISIPYKHSSCSAAASAHPKSHFTLARAGIGGYGLWPSLDNKKMTNMLHPHFSLKPVLTWKTKILQIKDIPAGSTVGYDRTYFTHEPIRIAILQVGYWDGYDRKLSNKGCVVINNQRAPIIGRIAMNLCMVNITGLQVNLDDEVILLGNHPGITADDLAQICQTINYEIVTRINPLLPRIIKEIPY